MFLIILSELFLFLFFHDHWWSSIAFLTKRVSLTLKLFGLFNLASLCRILKLPSRRPSIVCESCLYSLEKDMRVRAFHIMDPKGIVEMLLIFLEERGDGVLLPPSLDNNMVNFTKKTSSEEFFIFTSITFLLSECSILYYVFFKLVSGKQRQDCSISW